METRGERLAEEPEAFHNTVWRGSNHEKWVRSLQHSMCFYELRYVNSQGD
jgi:hypothetical protein